jgi:hypothetical protein
MKTVTSRKSITAIGGESPTNGAEAFIEIQKPYTVEVELTGVCPILFHRWNNESVAAKSAARKGSAEKKTDDIESFLYRNDKGEVCIPGEYVRQSMIHAAKFEQDPRSPRKSMMDLMKAAVVSLTDLATTGAREPDFLDKRRVMIQRSAITRTRPAMREGWKATFHIMVNLPEYVQCDRLHYVLQQAGRLIGLGDFRPSYGRFSVTRFEVLGK